MKIEKNKKAFSIVELLVIMGIIAILTGLGVFGISTLQRSSRDTQRSLKLAEIQNELNDVIKRGTALPTSFNSGDVSQVHITVNSKRIDLIGNLQRTSPDTASQDSSVSNTDYCYGVVNRTYVVGARLESGSYTYVTNNNGVYSSTTAFNTNPQGGAALACTDSNL